MEAKSGEEMGELLGRRMRNGQTPPGEISLQTNVTIQAEALSSYVHCRILITSLLSVSIHVIPSPHASPKILPESGRCCLENKQLLLFLSVCKTYSNQRSVSTFNSPSDVKLGYDAKCGYSAVFLPKLINA